MLYKGELKSEQVYVMKVQILGLVAKLKDLSQKKKKGN